MPHTLPVGLPVDEPLPVGVVGLGDIAQKAYLPVLGALPGLDLRLMTRDREKVERLGHAHRVAAGARFTDLGELIDSGIRAAFVHAATDQHVPIVERLLSADVDVYVDKPLDQTLDGARRLVELAERRGRSLMVGFNRRYAPGYVEAAAQPRDLVLLQKNRRSLPEAARSMVFDDFVHVVDTLRFLLPTEATHRQVRWRCTPGPDGRPLVRHLVLELSGHGFTALGIMNRESGATEEVLEVSGRGAKLEVRNLAEVVTYPDGDPRVRRRPDWVPVARQRGIEQVVLAFLDAVRSGTRIDARDALATHELCEWIVGQIE
ncbi:Gfo/Idh/MocA family protein [Streptacidiphilus neutrinimicus]|uniref:Gfo/Idh/MocA family protein n=1 Tax=Streptacidiphilus neutrinimicus TaxID=105420 RepID=UPI000AAD1850|nr:Gfo/Idh/MocA family oxidoreductase [Streptacidiphilus neutrinimicus]